jgi:UDP-3-O-[3-hydroxymyristoyl] N-acetylglucosamine deacetylase
MLMKSAPVTQKTLKAAIHCIGVGLHSGVKVSMTLRPAAIDTGILFRRIDPAGGGAEILAHWENAVESALCTTLTNGEGISIMTVEHLMSALAGCGVDNVVVELDGQEVPVMDGSAAPFVFLIECAGIEDQDEPRRAIKILKPVTVIDGQKSATLSPDHGLTVSFAIDFDSQVIRRQDKSFMLDAGTFKSEISQARTFGFLHDLDRMRAAGLARGGSLENAIVVSGDAVLNEGGLRYDDEFVRHKILDAVGDLYLAGGPIIGRFRGVRSSHAMTRRLLQTLFADPDAWCHTLQTAADLAMVRPWQSPAQAIA